MLFNTLILANPETELLRALKERLSFFEFCVKISKNKIYLNLFRQFTPNIRRGQ